MMTQRRAEELYQNELAKYNEDTSMLTHAAQNERRWADVSIDETKIVETCERV